MDGNIFCVLGYLAVLINLSSSANNSGKIGYYDDKNVYKKIVVDISEIFESYLVTGNSTSMNIFEGICNVEAITDIIMYYETDLHESTLENLINLNEWIQKYVFNECQTFKNNSEVMLGLRYSLTNDDVYLDEKLLSKQINSTKQSYLDVISYMEKYTYFASLLFVYPDKADACPKICPNFSSAKTNILKHGQVLTIPQLRCSCFTEYGNGSDIIVTKIDFQHYKNFVESFSAFKNLLDVMSQNVSSEINKNQFVEPVLYYHLTYKFVEGQDFEMIKNASSLWEGFTYLITIGAMQEVELDTNNEYKIEEKYYCLFKSFVEEYVTLESNAVIIDPSYYYKNCSFRYSLPLITPDFTWPSPLDEFFGTRSCNSWRSAQLTIQDILENGFDIFSESPFDRPTTQQDMQNLETECPKIWSGATPKINANFDVWLFKPSSFEKFNLEYAIFNASYFGKKQKIITINMPYSLSTDLWSQANFSMPMLSNQTMFYCKASRRKLDITGPTNDTLEFVKIMKESLTSYFWLVGIGNNFISEYCNQIILEFQLFDPTASANYYEKTIYMDGLLKKLKQGFLMTRGLINLKWPNKTVSLFVSGGARIWNDDDAHLFCNQNVRNLFEYYDAILTWAEIYQIPVIVQESFNGFYPNPISFTKFDPDFDILPGVRKNSFKFYYRIGYNTNKIFGGWTKGMKSCINWLSSVPLNGVSFASGKTGGFLDLSFRACNLASDYREMEANEIYKMLFYTMQTFNKFEILLSTETQLLSILEAVSVPEFYETVVFYNFAGKEILFSIPTSLLGNQNALYIQNVTSTLYDVGMKVNIHFQYSEQLSRSLESTNMSDITEMTESSDKKEFGIEWHNCAETVSWLTTAAGYTGSNTTYEENISFMKSSNLSYIVCTMPVNLQKLTTKEEVQKYLMTHVYIKRILQFFLPTVTRVIFKLLQSNNNISDDDKYFLVFLNHITSFAKSFDIEYILLPVLSTKNSGEYGWWQVSNCSHIGDTNVFLQNIQDKYFGIDSKAPNITIEWMTKKEIEEPFKNNRLDIIGTPWLVSGLIVTVAVLTILLSGVILKARMNAKLLSDEEVKEFLRGRLESSVALNEANNYNLQHLGEKFKDEFVMNKTDISLDTKNVLGMGNFGVVYNALLSDGTHLHGTSVAVKMPKMGCGKGEFLGMLREVKLLSCLGKHDNLVGFIGAYTKEIQRGVLYIVMELCSGGSLLSHLRNLKAKEKNGNGQGAWQPDLIRFCREIASGMEYVASRDIIHGDLSARNVLLDEREICKISDFGLSRKLYTYQTYAKKSQEPLPWRWMSVESLKQLEFSTMSDVWSFGVTAWEIFSLGDVPYPGLSWSIDFVEKLEDGMRLSNPQYGTDEIFGKMETCWRVDPEERPKFSELVIIFGELLPYTDLS